MKKTSYILASFVLCNAVGLTMSFADPNVENGKTIYEAKCAACHGKSGAGDGKKAKSLDTKPTAFNDPATFTDKKKLEITPDERLAKAIKEGGKAVGQSKSMDAFPSLTDQEIQDLIGYMKSLAKK